MNRETVLARVGGDEELLEEIVGLFLEDCPDMMAAIERAVESRSALDLQRCAHRLKGAAANFCAAEAVNAALRLELMGRAGDLLGLESAWQELRSSVAGLEPELRRLARRDGSSPS